MFDILSIPKGGKGTSLGRSRSKTEPAFRGRRSGVDSLRIPRMNSWECVNAHEYKKRAKELEARNAEIQAILKSLEEYKNNIVNN